CCNPLHSVVGRDSSGGTNSKVRDLELARARRRRWREQNADKIYLSEIRRRYGLTREAFERLLSEQGDACSICRRKFEDISVRVSRAVRVDHKHGTRCTRGLLCNRCNTGLGQFGDSADSLRSAADYLEHHAAKAAK